MDFIFQTLGNVVVSGEHSSADVMDSARRIRRTKAVKYLLLAICDCPRCSRTRTQGPMAFRDLSKLNDIVYLQYHGFGILLGHFICKSYVAYLSFLA